MTPTFRLIILQQKWLCKMKNDHDLLSHASKLRNIKNILELWTFAT